MNKIFALSLFLASVLFNTSVLALNVTGNIDTDVTWSIGNSPVNLVGDVTIKNGATLTIEAGVEVQMNGHVLKIGSASTFSDKVLLCISIYSNYDYLVFNNNGHCRLNLMTLDLRQWGEHF